MTDLNLQFALNHMACPNLTPEALVDAASELGIQAIELRNDVRENSVTEPAQAESVGRRAREKGIDVLSLNALYPFNIWSAERAQQADQLASVVAAAGGRGLVCCPLVDADYQASDQEKAEGLRGALSELAPILDRHGIKGYVEALGFPISSLRHKKTIVDAIRELKLEDIFGLVHDTFHHAGACESVYFPAQTGLIHVSGVEDPNISFEEMLDAHRFFVGPKDRLGSLEQVRELLKGGYHGYISFEPFADELWREKDPVARIQASMDYMHSAL